MGKAVEITGQRYGKLVVLGRVGSQPVSKATATRPATFVSTWEVKCDCGVVKVLRADDLRSKKVKSCGCWKRELLSLPVGMAVKNRVLGWYKQHAQKRSLAWEISKERFGELTAQNCFYCELPPMTEARSYYNTGNFLYNGIDRRDNAQGYIEENVVPCCKVCNRMKMDLSEKDFLAHVARIQTATAGNAR